MADEALRSAYVIVGDEEFLVSRALEGILARASEAGGGEEISVESLDAADGLSADLPMSLATVSLFGGRRVLVVRNAQQMDAKLQDALVSTLASPPERSTLILVTTSATRMSKLSKAVQAVGEVVRVERMKPADRMSWLRREFASHGRTATDAACQALLDTVGADLRELAQAVSQVVLSHLGAARVDAPDVDDQFRGGGEADERTIFAFVDQVFTGRAAGALVNLDRLMASGDDPLRVLGMLARQVRLLLRVREAGSAPRDALAAQIGVRDFVVDRLRAQARRYSPQDLREALDLIAQADLDCKGAEDLPARLVLELLVVQLAGSLQTTV
ncbi:MAG: DNA polymerase III subunit delta [Actinomycetota bacterium]